MLKGVSASPDFVFKIEAATKSPAFIRWSSTRWPAACRGFFLVDHA